MADGDDDLDLLDERTEALWDSKIVAMVSQSAERNVEFDESGPSSYDEDDGQSIISLDNDNDKSENEQDIIEKEILISSSNQNQGETNASSTSENVVTEKPAKWSFNDLYDIGLGPNPDVGTTGDSGKVKSAQRPPDNISQSESGPDVVNSAQKTTINNAVDPKSHQQSPPVPKMIVIDKEDEELDDYVDSDSADVEEIPSSHEKTFVSDSRLKRMYDKSSFSPSLDSDDDLVSSPLESVSPDQPKITARRKFPTKRLLDTSVSDVSDDSSSPLKKFSLKPDNKNTKKPTISEMEPPLKVVRIKNEGAQGDSGLCVDGDLHSERIITRRYEGIRNEPESKGIKCTASCKDVPGIDSKATIKLSKNEKDNTMTSQGRQPQQTFISRPGKNQTASALDPRTASKEDIDKVCEWFPDACRKWVKLKIEIAKVLGNEQYLDHLVDSMLDGKYPKSTSTQNDPAARLDGKEPDIIVALGNNRIKTPTQSAERLNETDSGPVRLYGKKANYVGGPKGKGRAVFNVPRKPVRNALDEYQSSEEEEKDICMDAAESMDTLRDSEVSSSSLTCESCKMNRNTDMVVQCCDGHLICNSCVEKEVKEILSPDSQETQIKCPSENCQSKVPESQAKKILPNLILELLEEKLHKQAVESIIKMEDLVTCPNCSFPVVMDAGIKEFECPNCKNTSCRYCKRLWVMTSHADCNQFTTFLQENLDSKDLELPSYWHPIPEEGDKDYVIVNLEEKCVEFQHIKTLFSHSMSASQITAVRRVQNPRLWQKFCLARKHMVEDFGQNQLNEKQLFHGTSTKAFDGICREGLDWRMCGENGTAFGQGTYFAKRAAYSDRYSQVTPGFSSIRPLPAGNSSASFAQAFNLPSSFNTPPNNAPNPFQPTQQQSSLASFNFGNLQPQQQQRQNVFKTTSQAFPYVPLSSASNANSVGISSNTFFQSANNNGAAMLGPFGPSNNNGQPGFGQLNFGPPNPNNPLAKFPDYNQGQVMPANVSNPLVSSTTDKIVFTNVDDTIGPNKKYMFVARALVGRCCRGNHGIRKPPSDPDDPKRRPFNSCVDNVLTPSIFVIFDCAQCYPEYIVEYSSR